MKTILLLLGMILAAAPSKADSKYTAHAILANPSKHEGKEVKLDVASLFPVHVKSPVPDVAFFRAVTYDRWDHRPGGAILVAVQSSEVEKIAEEFGIGRDGRGRNPNSLKGVLIATPGSESRPRLWIVDTTGTLEAQLAARGSKNDELVRELETAESSAAVLAPQGGLRGPGAGPRRQRP